MAKKTGKFAWDRGLDYDEVRRTLVDGIAREAPEAALDIVPKKRLTHYSILLTQLTNGTRVSEAFDAVKFWSENLEREQQVQIRKLGKVVRCEECGAKFSNKSRKKTPKKHAQETGHKKGYTETPVLENRLIVIPSECLPEDVPYIQESLKRGLTVGAVKAFALRNLNYNTHALRYAKITSLSRQGKPAQLIAKLTGHKSLNFIMDYTSKSIAEDVLRESVG